MDASAPKPNGPSREFLRRAASHAALVSGVNVLVGFGLALSRSEDWRVSMVYSQAIGLSIWALIDFGRFLFKRDPETNWPLGWRAFALQAFGVVCGYVIGTLIGDIYSGRSTFALWDQSQSRFAGFMLMSIGISAAITSFFISRGREQKQRRQVAAAQRDAAEARLKLLESQLEPHMLFNTLANLRALIALDPPRAQAMLDRLIAFLRATLNGSRQRMHPLADEFARIADYLALMQVRMGERLQVSLELPEALASQPVPPLILQPLVENAIKHGLEPQRGAGTITVRASLVDETLQLEVCDSGLGLKSGMPADEGGFGLTQVSTRLTTLYGDRARLELHSRAEGGTLARLRLPIDTEGQP